MKLLWAALLLASIPSSLSVPADTPIAARTVSQIPSAVPTLDPSWRTNRARQRKHVHDFFKLFGWLRQNETLKERDIPAAIRKIQRLLREPETGVYDERLEAVMSRPRCGTVPQYNATDAKLDDAGSGLHKRYVLWGPKWNHQTVTYRFINYTSDVASDQQRSILSEAFAQWNALLPISIVPATSNTQRADIHVRFMSMGPAEPAYAFTNMIASGLTMASGLINITFNDDYNWADDRLFRFTAVHEIGHTLGLSHSKVEDAVMWPYYEGLTRTMHPDDKAAIHTLYGWKEPRWNRIDANSATNYITQVSSATTNPQALDGLYQLRSTGQVLFYTNNAWTTVDNNRNTVQIAGANGNLYQRHVDGSVYRYTGSGQNWQYIGAASDNVIDIVAASDQIYQRRKDGWIARWSGSGTTWTAIANPRQTQQIAVTDSKILWNLLPSGDLVRSEWPYGSGWTIVDYNSRNIQIATGGNEFYKLQSDGLVVWLDMINYYWVTIENSRSVAIYAVGSFIYSRHSDSSIWRYTGTPYVWEMLDGKEQGAVSVIGDRKGVVWEMKGNGNVLRLAASN